MPWLRRKLRDNLVYVRARADGQVAADASGRVDVLYQLRPGAKLYRASIRNLAPSGDPDDRLYPDPAPSSSPSPSPSPSPSSPSPSSPSPSSPSPSSPSSPSRSPRSPSPSPQTSAPARSPGGNLLPYHDGPLRQLPKASIAVWTDGACTGNPGPMGIGVVVVDGKERKELGEYLGIGTNNIAELAAIVRGLELIDHGHRGRAVYVHSDSGYALGLLGKGWKAKANRELVGKLRALASEFPDLHLVKVPGHAGVSENERCDELARMAIIRGR